MSEQKTGNKTRKIAYCPTMDVYAKRLFGIDGMEVIQVPSAGQALYLLKSDAVDAVLIGRYAQQRELNGNTKFLKLKDGYTLVYRNKIAIPVEQLKEIEVITYLNKKLLSDIAPLFGHIKYLVNINECLKYNLEVPIIIDWNDYRDDFELLIPMNNDGSKVIMFRAPVLYHRNMPERHIEIIGQKIS